MDYKDITVIIPVHVYNQGVEAFLHKAVQSAKGFPVVYVGPAPVIEAIELPGEKIENSGATDYCSQVNLAASKVKTEYFTVLEYDDEFTHLYGRMMKEYVEAYPETDLFLPIIALRQQGKFRNLMNQGVWSRALGAEEIGVIDEKVLEDFAVFNLGGAVIRREKFIELGGFKSNIKLTFHYEFIYRLTRKGHTARVTNRLGYIHEFMRPGSYLDELSAGDEAGRSPEEQQKFWTEVAKEESQFTFSRPIMVGESAE